MGRFAVLIFNGVWACIVLLGADRPVAVIKNFKSYSSLILVNYPALFNDVRQV